MKNLSGEIVTGCENCENCKYGSDYGDSVEYIWCERKSRKKSIKKIDTCEHYESEVLKNDNQ